MNEEIRCITNEGEAAWNEWENDDSDFFRALYSLCKKIRAIFFHTLLPMHSSVAEASRRIIITFVLKKLKINRKFEMLIISW